MPTIYKRASVQGTNAVSTYATLYSGAPVGASVVLSTIAIVNTGASTGTYRIGFASSAIEPLSADWLVYGGTCPANDTIFITVGVTLAAGTLIRVSSSATTMSFQAFLSEIT